MDKDQNFIKENSIIFKKYKIKSKLGEGAFGDVYKGSCIETNELVAIKVERKKILKPLLETEAFFLYSLRGFGIPEVLSFGRLKNYNVLVEPLLDKSLFDIFNENRRRLQLGDICMIGMQIIDRIQWVHSKNIVHRDIKPDNFLIGRKDPNVIYLIDFGLSKKFKSSTTGKHIKFGFTGKLTGTVRFASANALRGGEQSRRDDLESIGYMIIYFMRGKLPWQEVKGNKKIERYLKIYKMKKNVSPEDLCKSLPQQMKEYMKYVKNLEFEQDPDYNFLRNLFKTILKRMHESNEKLLFSWIKLADVPKLKNPVNPTTRKESPQSRLYRKIQNSLDHGRNLSSDNDSGQNSFQTSTVTVNTNIKVLSKTDSKDEINTDNENTKKVRSKDALNTIIANLNITLDEKLVIDFENEEKMKPSSNDIGPYKINYDGKINNKNLTVNENIKLMKKIHKEDFSNYSSYKKKGKNLNNNIEEKLKEFKIKNEDFQQAKSENKVPKNEKNDNFNLNNDIERKFNINENNNMNYNKELKNYKYKEKNTINDDKKNIELNNANDNYLNINKKNSILNDINNINLKNKNNINYIINNNDINYNKISGREKFINRMNQNNNNISNFYNEEMNIDNKVIINNKNSNHNNTNNNYNNTSEKIFNNNNEEKTNINNIINGNNINFNQNITREPNDEIIQETIKDNKIINQNDIIQKEPNDGMVQEENMNNKILNKYEIKKEPKDEMIQEENINNNNILNMNEISQKEPEDELIQEENVNNNEIYQKEPNDEMMQEAIKYNKKLNKNEIKEPNDEMIKETNEYNKKLYKNKINQKEPNNEMKFETNHENTKINNKQILMRKISKKANLNNYNYNKENMSKSIINSPNKVYQNYLMNNNIINENQMNILHNMNSKTAVFSKKNIIDNNSLNNGNKLKSLSKNNERENPDDRNLIMKKSSLEYMKKNTNFIPTIKIDNNLDILPKNSDENIDNAYQDFFNNIEYIKKINSNKLKKNNNLNNILENKMNNYKNSKAKKGNRSNRSNINIHQKNKMNLNRIEYGSNNNINKTLPNYSGLSSNSNINNHEFIRSSKKMMNKKNKNNNFNLNNINIIPTDNNDSINKTPINNDIDNNYMYSIYNNALSKEKRNNNKKLINNNKRNEINMNINNNINNNIIINNNYNNMNDLPLNTMIENNIKNNSGAINLMNQMPYYSNKNNINSLYNLNHMNINKRPSYNDRRKINNLEYINQMNADKRPSYNTNYNVSNIINVYDNNSSIGLNPNFQRLNCNPNRISRKTNFGINNNNYIISQRNLQDNKINMNNYNTQIFPSSHKREFLKKNLIYNANFQDLSGDINNQRYQNTFNEIPANSEEMFNLSLKKSNIKQNHVYNFNFNENSNIKNRNESSLEVNKNLFS